MTQTSLTSIPDDQGFLTVTGTTDPAANTEITLTIGANRRWLVFGFYYRLVTNANAANRRSHVRITDGTNEIFFFQHDQVQAASITRDYSWAPRGGFVGAILQSRTSAHMPVTPMFQGWTIETITEGIQATDNYGAGRVVHYEWIEE